MAVGVRGTLTLLQIQGFVRLVSHEQSLAVYWSGAQTTEIAYLMLLE